MKTTVIAITGPSGFDKGELVKELIKLTPSIIEIIAYTDRPPWPHETNERDFHFISEEEFTGMVQAEKFIEWQRLLSNNFRYGKTKQEFTDTITQNAGKIIFSTVNVINLPLLKRYYPEMKSIFIDVKDTQALLEYLNTHGCQGDDEEFDRRLKFATEERRRRHLADLTINMKDDFAASVEELINAVNILVKSK